MIFATFLLSGMLQSSDYKKERREDYSLHEIDLAGIMQASGTNNFMKCVT